MSSDMILYLLHCRRDDLYWGANSKLFISGLQECPFCGDDLVSVPLVLENTELPQDSSKGGSSDDRA